MVSLKACKLVVLGAALAVALPALASRTHRTTAAGHRSFLHRHFRGRSSKRIHVVKGQRGIDSDRARQIQTALIRENYLSGQPTGQWDDQTQAAMQKYQADHGWQTKLMPDSRALIKLGLGPSATAEAVPSAPAAASSAPPPAANTLASAHSIQN